MSTLIDALRDLICTDPGVELPTDAEQTGVVPVPDPFRVRDPIEPDFSLPLRDARTDSTAKFVYSYPYTSPDGRFMPVSWGQLTPPAQPAITDADLAQLADQWRVPKCHLRAVLSVESAGSGFLLNEPAPARPKILFEAHWFYRLTPQPVSQTRPDLSSKRWDRSLYKGGSAEWDRLKDAMKFDEVQALKSCSWGLGQVMGFNYAVAGCDSVEQFVVENFTGEKEQFNHMLNFIDNNGLMSHLRAGRWASFARGYNGAGYRANRYDEKLAAAAKRCR
jgi:hypothetical protein